MSTKLSTLTHMGGRSITIEEQSNIVTENQLHCSITIEDTIVNNTISGYVQITTEVEGLIIQSAIIEVYGIASTSWVLEKPIFKFPNFYRKGTTVSASEEFYFSRHTLCGGEISHKHKKNEVYNFTCGWFTRLPPTFDGEFGRIRYIGKVKIKTPNSCQVYTQKLPVSPNRDLTLEKHLLFEARQDITRNFNYSRHSGAVKVSLWLPICGIAAGQSMPVVCSVENNSNLHFGGLVFVLTRIDIYISVAPIKLVKKVRTDICRVARMVHVHKGKYDYYAVLKTEKNTLPTNQFSTCKPYQIIYEAWVSLQGNFPRYKIYGYPNIDTPGIPVIIGTKPIKDFDADAITAQVLSTLHTPTTTGLVDALPRDEEVEELLNAAEEELDEKTMRNLTRQFEENDEPANARSSMADVTSI